MTSGTRQVGGWGRRRLLMILAAVVLMMVSLVFGLIMVVNNAATQVWRADDTGGDPAGTDRQHRPRPGDDAARFYAAEAAKVIQAFFHAAALTGRSLDDVLRWVADPVSASEPSGDSPSASPRCAVLARAAARRFAR